MSWNFLDSRNTGKLSLKYKEQGGFGLIELLVSISIMVIVASVIFSRQGSFNSTVLLRNEAYDIALRIREIQLNAVSASSGGDGDFRSVLGVHFDTDPANNKVYNIFRDSDLPSINADGFYQASEQFDLQGVIDPRFEIRAIREINGTGLTPAQVSIIFVRPNFDARFFDAPAGELTGNGVEIDIGEVGKTGVKTIEVTSTGQISVI